MKEQIRQMAWDLCDIPKHPSIKSCDECGGRHCHATYYAERAINEGYRKQREGEWVYGEYDLPHCSECGFEPKSISPFCPECGAIMEATDEKAET